MTGFLPAKELKIVTKSSPVVSNDILIEFNKEYLLLKRKNQPAKGLWWTPGGRLWKNEKIVDSVHRITREELGIKKIKIKKFLGVFEFFSSPGKFGQKDVHNITFAFLVEPVGQMMIKMDSQHSEYRFFSKPPKDAHPFIKDFFFLAKKKNYNLALPQGYKIKS